MFSEKLLNDKAFIQPGIQQPFLIVENALLPEFAEQLYSELQASDAWQTSDPSSFTAEEKAVIPAGYSFTREIINLDDEKLPATVKKLYQYLKSDECLKWISEMSGRRCDDFSGACARYLGGNHLNSHNDFYMKRQPDGSMLTRTVTFNYYLTKDWSAEWGGNFVWENPHNRITPSFNTLVLFLVGHDSMHHVEAVDQAATSPRVAFTGWFTTRRKAGDRKLNISTGSDG
ncbi:MAG TPA: 2OG-Fe(II) oxygenase [Thiotrichales bacterium]|nr:2OG-Fe(II) oxygenase [Thiotrichales bacterium]